MARRIFLSLVLLVAVAAVAGFALVWKPAIAPVPVPARSSFAAAQVTARRRTGGDRRLRRLPYRGGRTALCRRPRACRRRSARSTPPTSRPTRRPASAPGRRPRSAAPCATASTRDGAHLYPALPYTHFTRATDDDIAALYAFLMTRAPVQAPVAAEPAAVPAQLRRCSPAGTCCSCSRARGSRSRPMTPTGIAAPISSRGSAIAAPATRRATRWAPSRAARRFAGRRGGGLVCAGAAGRFAGAGAAGRWTSSPPICARLRRAARRRRRPDDGGHRRLAACRKRMCARSPSISRR